MPDLNYENPEVRAEAARVGKFWLTEMGVDGFRLDAVPYLVEEGTTVSNTAGTHAVLRDFAASVRRNAPGAFTVGEVWDSIGAIMPYYPDQLDSYFSFELSDALLDAVRTGQLGEAARGLCAHAARDAGDALVALPAQPRPDAHAHRARRRPRRGTTRGRAAAHAARTALRLLRRGDRHDGRQARPAPAHADAVDAGPRRRLHDGRARGSRCSPTPRRRTSRWRAATPRRCSCTTAS